MPARPITPRRAETRQRLIDGAVGVFADRGVLAASVEEICDRAGYTRGAFYSNFASKADLVRALLEVDRQRWQRNVDDLLSGDLVEQARAHPENFTALLDLALRSLIDIQHNERDWVITMAEMRLYAVREPEVRDDYLAHRRVLQGRLRQLFLEAAAPAGWTFAVPEDVAIQVLDSAYESAVLERTLAGSGPDRGADEPDPIGPLSHLLGRLVRPAETAGARPRPY